MVAPVTGSPVALSTATPWIAPAWRRRPGFALVAEAAGGPLASAPAAQGATGDGPFGFRRPTSRMPVASTVRRSDSARRSRQKRWKSASDSSTSSAVCGVSTRRVTDRLTMRARSSARRFVSAAGTAARVRSSRSISACASSRPRRGPAVGARVRSIAWSRPPTRSLIRARPDRDRIRAYTSALSPGCSPTSRSGHTHSASAMATSMGGAAVRSMRRSQVLTPPSPATTTPARRPPLATSCASSDRSATGPLEMASMRSIVAPPSARISGGASVAPAVATPSVTRRMRR